MSNNTEQLPRIYLSGTFSMNMAQWREWVGRVGSKYRCYSYAFVSPDAFFYSKQMEEMMNYDIEQGIGIMMDSGAFSFHQFLRKKKLRKDGQELRMEYVDKLREETIENYAKFIKKTGKKLDFYVNFDVVKEAKVVYEIQKKLEKLGIRPMPMYHGDAELEYLERYLKEGYEYIGLGSSGWSGGARARMKWKNSVYYLSNLFNLIEKYSVRGKKIKTHGFARTSMAMIYNWPFYSVDSSTWAKVGCYGSIMIPSNRGLKSFSVSLRKGNSGVKSSHQLESVTLKHVIDFVESRGFSYDEMTKSKQERDIFNGYIAAHLHEWKDAYLATKGERTRWEVLL